MRNIKDKMHIETRLALYGKEVRIRWDKKILIEDFKHKCIVAELVGNSKPILRELMKSEMLLRMDKAIKQDEKCYYISR